ncbi:hypothetical protein K0M31_010560, partial [Melipona bicolor]
KNITYCVNKLSKPSRIDSSQYVRIHTRVGRDYKLLHRHGLDTGAQQTRLTPSYDSSLDFSSFLVLAFTGSTWKKADECSVGSPGMLNRAVNSLAFHSLPKQSPK